MSGGSRSKMPIALVVGTDHAFQRHQDRSEENEAIRNAFEVFLRAAIQARVVDAIAEEAGDDREVWEHLRAQDAVISEEWRGLFAGIEIVGGPQPPIARSLAAAGDIAYRDVRAVGGETMTIEERDEAMARATAEHFRGAESLLVIVGDDHREEVARILGEKYGWKTESKRFP